MKIFKSKFFTGIFFLSTLFILLLYLMEKIPVYHEILRDIALAVGPLLFFTLFWEYWVRDARDEEVKNLISNVLSEQFSDINAVHESGLLKIHSRISNEALREFIERAQHNLRILVPWFVDPSILKETLKEKTCNPSFSMQIFLLEPDSQFLLKRGQVIQPTQPMYGHQECVRTLLALHEALNDKNPNTQVLVYDSLPSIFIAEADNHALMGLYLHTGMALRNPHFEIQITRDGRKTMLGQMIQEELSKILAISKIVDLGSVRQDRDGTFHYRTVQDRTSTES